MQIQPRKLSYVAERLRRALRRVEKTGSDWAGLRMGGFWLEAWGRAYDALTAEPEKIARSRAAEIIGRIAMAAKTHPEDESGI